MNQKLSVCEHQLDNNQVAFMGRMQVVDGQPNITKMGEDNIILHSRSFISTPDYWLIILPSELKDPYTQYQMSF